jgi:hypothetical protein
VGENIAGSKVQRRQAILVYAQVTVPNLGLARAVKYVLDDFRITIHSTRGFAQIGFDPRDLPVKLGLLLSEQCIVDQFLEAQSQ